MSATPDDFLRHLQARGFKGSGLMLRAFVDETASRSDPKLVGVAATLFDYAGIETFTRAWADFVDEYQQDFQLDVRPFHATECCGPLGHGSFEGWFPELRHRACRDLAKLVARTRRLAVVSTIEDADYEEFQKRTPHSAQLAGTPYLAAVLTCMGLAAHRIEPEERIFYVFERGGAYERELKSLINKIEAREDLVQKYRYQASTFLPKHDPHCLPMKATDLLAWALQDHYVRDDIAERDGLEEQPSELLKILAGDDSRPVLFYPLGPTRLALESMIRRWVP